MKMKMKRVLSVLLTLVIVLGLIPPFELPVAKAATVEAMYINQTKGTSITGTFAECWNAAHADTNTDVKLVKLLADVTANSSGSLGSGTGFGTAGGGTGPICVLRSYLTLDLNGYTIDRGLTESTSGGAVIYIYSNSSSSEESGFTIMDSSPGQTGTITGGYNSTYGGCISFASAPDYGGGRVTMLGGNIVGNASKTSGGAVGGYYTSSKAASNGGAKSGTTIMMFTMRGGKIEGNEAGSNGGAIYIFSHYQYYSNGRYYNDYDSGSFSMYGGTITNNKAKTSYAAVYSCYLNIYGGSITKNTASKGSALYCTNDSRSSTGTNNSTTGPVNLHPAPEYGPIVIAGNLNTSVQYHDIFGLNVALYGLLQPGSLIGVSTSSTISTTSCVIAAVPSTASTSEITAIPSYYGTEYFYAAKPNAHTEGDGSNINIVYGGLPTTYKLHHYKQNAAKTGYVLAETETIDCSYYTPVTATPKNYAGYTVNYGAEGMIMTGVPTRLETLELAFYYDRNGYVVTFDPANGDAVIEQSVADGGTVTAPTVTKEGHTLSGWTTADGTVFDFSTPITSDITLTAQWVPDIASYTVQHYFQNASLTGYTMNTSLTETLSGTPGTTVTATAKSVTGFTRNLTHASAVTSATLSADGSTILKVYYDRKVSTLKWIVDGSIYHTASQAYGSTIEYPEEPTMEGHTFNGWFDSETDGSEFTATTFDQTSDMLVYAQFTANTYDIKFYVDGSLVATKTQTYGQSKNFPPNPSKEGYSFKGWYTSASSGTKHSSSGTWTTTSIPSKLYAQWTPNSDTAYIIEHYQQNVAGTGYVLKETEELTGTTDEEVFATPMSYTGFTENTGHDNRIESDTIAPDGSTVLRLYYDRKSFTLTWNNDGATSKTTQLYESSVKLPAEPEKEGYTFLGWFTSASGGTQITSSTKVMANKTYYAVFEANTDTAYKIEHYKQNLAGTGYDLADTENKTGTTGETVTATPKSYDGFKENKSYYYSKAEGEILPDGSLVLKLYYDRVAITVTLDPGNGNTASTQVVPYGGTVTKPTPDPVKAGYDFTGWKNGDAVWNFTDPVTSAMTLVGSFTPRNDTPYKVEHYQQNVDGNGYTLAKTDNLQGTTDTITKVTVNSSLFTGFTENSGHPDRVDRGKITADGSLVLKLYYDRNQTYVTFDPANGQSTNRVAVVFGNTVAKPADPVRAGYTFMGWMLNGNAYDFATSVTDSITLIASWRANGNTTYKVEHYHQNVNGIGYTLAKTDTLSGTTDTTAIASPATPTGFTENTTHDGRVESGNIAGDGTLVLKLYYDRNSYTITIEPNDGGTATTQTVLHGACAVAPASNPGKPGYTFDGWTVDGESFTFDKPVTGPMTIKAVITPRTDTPYKVEHYQQNIDGSGYTLAKTDNLQGTTDTITKVTVNSSLFTGFTENSGHPDRKVQGTVTADGSLVLKLFYDRNNLTVTYDADNGTANTTLSIPFGTILTAPETPVKPGYTFLHWALDGSKYDFSQPVSATITLVAIWVADSDVVYKIEHYVQAITNDGYELYDTDTLVGVTDTTVTAVPKTESWLVENKTHDGRVASGTVSASTTLVLKLYYTRVEYRVTLNPKNGDAMTTKNVRHGGLVEHPESLQRLGYVFERWVDQSGNEFDFDTPITKNTTITAEWSPALDIKYVVKHYQQNVSGVGYTIYATEVKEGATESTVTATPASYKGFTPDLTNIETTIVGTIMPDGSLVLEIYYNRNPMNITMDPANGDPLITSTVLYEQTANRPADPSKDGYVFSGWVQSAPMGAADTPMTVAGSTMWDFSTPVTDALSLVAEYTPATGQVYKIEHYHQNVDGTGYTLFETSQASGTTDTSVTAEARTYAGFVENMTHVDRIAIGTIPATGELVLKLYYDRVSVTVTFDPDNGDAPTTQTLLYGATATKPADPEKPGYVFMDWVYKDTSTAHNFTTAVVSDISLTARYAAESDVIYKTEHYQQTVDGSGYDLFETTSHVGATDETVTALTRIYEGFVENGAHPDRKATGIVPATGELVLKLYYDRTPVIVMFNADNGTVDTSQNLLYGAKATKPADPEKTGYVFDKWVNANTGAEFNFDTIIKEDVDLIAVYIKQHKVMFEPNNSDVYFTKLVLDGQCVEKPTDPVKYGYIFRGWELPDGSLFDFNTPVTGDLSLTAKWEAQTGTPYTVERYHQTLDLSDWVLFESETCYGTVGRYVEASVKVYAGFTYDMDDPRQVVTGTVQPDGGLVLKLYYARITMTVTFDARNDQPVVTQDVVYGGTVAKPADPVRAGYTFTGWELDNGDPVDFDQPITASVVYYGAWEARNDIEYKIEHYCQTDSGYDLRDTETLTGIADTEAIAQPRPYPGYTENTTHTDRVVSGIIAPDGSLVLKLFYDRNGNTEYKVEHYRETDSGYELFESETLYGRTDESITALAKTYPGYVENTTHSDRVASGVIKADGSLTLKLYYDRAGDTVYKIEHYKQTESGYTLHETETLTGRTDANVTATPKSYEGFVENTTHTDRKASGKIAADGSLVLKLYYDVGGTSVWFETEDGQRFEVDVAIGALVAEPDEVPTREGYVFAGWVDKDGNPFDFSKPIFETTIVYASWKVSDEIIYRVQHWRQDPVGDGYTLYETDTLPGTTDTSVTALAKSYTGFVENTKHADRIASGIVAADGSLVLKLYYDRTFVEVIIDFDNGTEPLKQTIRYGSLLNKPADPTKDRHQFVNWVDAKGNVFDFSKPVYANTSLKPKWVETRPPEVIPDTGLVSTSGTWLIVSLLTMVGAVITGGYLIFDSKRKKR